ncbi:LysR family transcriptional regulator [Streptosporangium sp. NPDC049046]|uniref:LysR family transcriptional regulator n=1 Tax=unclassified Streptosporangium TaxID=2632669 RepID=UPI003437B607
MDLHNLEYFLAVVDHQGINAAAESLHLSQPTISQSIRGLERELGTELFHRIGRGMVLTSAGHSLVGPARQILRDVVAAESSVVDAAGRLRGRLDIVAYATLSAGSLAELIGRFRERSPRVHIRIGDLQDEEAAASLIVDGHCEIVVCYLPTATGGLDTLPLGVQEFWAVFPPGTEVSRADPLPRAQLPDVPLIVVPPGSSWATEIERAVTAAGRLRRPAAIIAHREARLAFVLAGLGGTFMERSTAEAAAARGAVVRAVDPCFSRPYGLLFDPEALSPVGRAFIELVREQVADTAAAHSR